MSGSDPRTPVAPEDAIAERVRILEERLYELETPTGTQAYQAVSTLQAAVATLSDTVNQLGAQLSFLASQETGGSNAGNWAYFGNPGSDALNWQSFDPAYDVQASITSSDSGQLLITPSARLSSLGTGVAVGFEVTWAGGSISPNFGASAAAIADMGIYVTVAMPARVSVPANTACTVRTRRGIWGTTSGQAQIIGQALVVSKRW